MFMQSVRLCVDSIRSGNFEVFPGTYRLSVIFAHTTHQATRCLHRRSLNSVNVVDIVVESICFESLSVVAAFHGLVSKKSIHWIINEF